MNPQRGEVVTVAASGDFGKPRPAVVVQNDAFPVQHASVIVCRMIPRLEDAPDFRRTIEPLRGACRTEFEDSVWTHLSGTASAPFRAGKRPRIAGEYRSTTGATS